MIKRMNRVETSREDREGRKFGQSWLCFKIIKCIVIFICLIMLPLNTHLYPIKDDFTVVESSATKDLNKKHQNNQNNNRNHQMINQNNNENKSIYNHVSSKPVPNTRELVPLHTVYGNVSNDPKTRLSDLLIMYPCCTTVIIILGMELGGQALKDPLTKWPSLVLSLLCLLLACIVFIMSLMSIMRHVQAVMIVICILSMLFLVLEAVDISLSLLP